MDPIKLGECAAYAYKQALAFRRARAGRTAKGSNMQKQLHAAGQPKMNTRGVIGYPRGQSV